MKKLILIFLTVLIFCCFCGCNNSSLEPNNVTQPEPITLTNDNYQNYLSINMYLTDFNIVNGSPKYESVIVNIQTKKRANCYFENVVIEYKINYPNWNISDSSLKTNIDYNGESLVTYVAGKKVDGNDKFPQSTTDLTYIEHLTVTIRGNVYLY